VVVGNGETNPRLYREGQDPMSDGGRDREKAGGRKGRERGGGKKLRGTGEDEPARYKECAAFKKEREEREREREARGKPTKKPKTISPFFILLFYYLFTLIYHPSFSSPLFKPRR
jgi:hypothetical protein